MRPAYHDLTCSLNRLDVEEGNVIDNDSFPIDGALIGGYVETFGLSHYLEVLGGPDRDAKDGGEEECGCESLEAE